MKVMVVSLSRLSISFCSHQLTTVEDVAGEVLEYMLLS